LIFLSNFRKLRIFFELNWKLLGLFF
jgi:hypothetical protein